jgi:hypothetical protein
MKILRTIAGEVGKGLLAGLAGTAVMTLASALEAKVRKRPASNTPAEAAGRALEIQPRNDAAKKRLSSLVHFAYGTGWGLARAAIGWSFRAAGVRRPVLAPVSHFAAVWGTGLVMLPAMGVAPPVRRWGAEELALDGLHHVIYAAAVDGAYRALERF